MKGKTLWTYMPATGPVLSLLLIGIVLLSAVVYYRAVKIQRFLEPALALSQPRNEFSKNIGRKFEKEFGVKSGKGFKVKASSILLEQSFLFTGDGMLKPSALADLRKIARIFLSIMREDHLRSEISLVLIIARFPSSGATGRNAGERVAAQHTIAFIKEALFRAEPELGVRFPSYFAGVTLPSAPQEGNREAVEFRFIPSEFLHIEVLEKLEKYSY
jgi:hypothetical protein